MNSKDDNFSFLYEKALELISKRRLQEGELILDRLYSLGNINKGILNILGILSYLYCNFESAKNYWSESLELDDYENEAAKFLDDMDSKEFNVLENSYYESIKLIEDKNYKEAIKVLESIDEKRSGLVEVKEMLSLLYMIENKSYMALDKIKIATKIDKSNEKLNLIYKNIESTINKNSDFNDNSDEIIERFTVSEVILNLIMILNYKINDIYEDEYKAGNEEISRLNQLLEKKEEEVLRLKLENEEALAIIEEVRFRNESAYTEELDTE